MRGKQVYPIRRVWPVIILYLPIPIYTDGAALMLLLLVHTHMIHFFPTRESGICVRLCAVSYT